MGAGLRWRFIIALLGLGSSLVLACGGGSGATKDGGSGGTGGGTGGGGAGGGGNGGSGGANSDPQLQAFCEAVRTIQISYAGTCGGLPSAVAGQLLNLDLCASLKAGVASGAMGFAADKADACLAALRSLSCDADRTPSLCDSALWGQLKEGETCNVARSVGFFSECQTGTFCSGSATNGCVGTCVAYKLLGQDCTSVPCTPGETCNVDTGTCSPKGSKDDECGLSGGVLECGEGLYCSDLFGGICTPRQSSGTCSTGDECAAPTQCSKGVGSSGNCTLPKKPGDTCEMGAEECGAGMHCEVDDTCQPNSGPGKPCGIINGLDNEYVDCVAGYCDLNADSPVCKTVGAGKGCMLNADCGPNALCADGACTAACF